MSTRTLYRPVTHNHAEPGVEREFRQIYKILNRLGAPQVQRAAAVPQRAAPVAASSQWEIRSGVAALLPSDGSIEIKPDPPMSGTLRNGYALINLSIDNVMFTAAGKATQGIYSDRFQHWDDRFTVIRHRAPDTDDFDIEFRWTVLLPLVWPTYDINQEDLLALWLFNSEIGDGYVPTTQIRIADRSINMVDLVAGSGQYAKFVATGFNFDGVAGMGFSENFPKGFDYDAPSVPYYCNAPTFTLMAASQVDTGAGWNCLVENSTRDNTSARSNYFLGWDAGKAQGGFRSATGTLRTVTSPLTYSDASWHTTAVRYNGSSVDLFVDDMATPVAQLSTTDSPSQNRRELNVGFGYDRVLGAMAIHLKAQPASDIASDKAALAAIMTIRGVTLP